MGTQCASTYATLVLGYLEEKLYNIIKDTLTKNLENILKKCGVDI